MKKLHVLLLCLIIAAATVAITLTIVLVAQRTDKEELTYGSSFIYKNLEITIGSAEDVVYSVANDPWYRKPVLTLDGEPVTAGEKPVITDEEPVATDEESTSIYETKRVLDPDKISKQPSHGYDIFKLPVKVKNISNEAYNLEDLKYTFYGPDDLEILRESEHTPGIYNEIRFAGTVRKGGTVNGIFNIRYEGDGDYHIEIGDSLVKVPISKSTD